MTYASVSRWSWWAHGNPPSWGLLWVTVYTRLRPVPRKHVECVVCKHTLFFKCLRIDLGVFSHKPSGQPTHSLASSFERRKFPAAQVRNRWSTQAPPGTGAGGLWVGSWGEAAGLEASAHKHASQCPQWILGSHSSTVPLYLCFPCLSSTRQMKRQVLFLFFNFLRPKPLNHLWHISFFFFPHVKICHHILSALFSNWSQNHLVTWHQFHRHHPGPGHHCLLPRLLKWLLDHFFLLPSSFQACSQNTQSDSLQMYVISLLKTLFCFPLHLG